MASTISLPDRLDEARAHGDWDDVLTHGIWREVAHAWDRRDNRALRALLHDLLAGTLDASTARPTGLDVVPGIDPLKTWRRFSQANFSGRFAPLEALVGPPRASAGDTEAVWEHYAASTLETLQTIVATRPDADGPALEAALAVFIYFECLVFWEHSGDYTPIESLARALQVLHGSDAGGFARDVISAAADLASALPCQFRIEMGIGSCCPMSISSAAVETRRAFDLIGDRLVSLWIELHAEGVTPSPAIVALTALLLHDVDDTHRYHDLLIDEVAPASAAFIDNLVERRDDAEVERRIDQAVDRCQRFERSRHGQRAVFGSEARAHRTALEAAAQVVHDGHPSLGIERGEVVFLYPFGLPVAGTGTDPVRRALRAHFEGDPASQIKNPIHLAGAPVALDDTPQTDAWLDSPSAEDLDFVGVRLLFAEHELVYELSDDRWLRDLGIEVRLGGLGNHYVRISVGPDTLCSVDKGATWQRNDRRWTPHDLDQFVRRGNTDTGGERVWLRPRSTTSRHSATSGEAMLIDLAGRIVNDLVAYAKELEATSEVESDAPGAVDHDLDTPDVIEDFLRRHAHVAVVVTGLTAVADGEAVAVEDPTALLGLVGANVLLTGQRPFAQSPVEWTRFPATKPDTSLFELMGTRIRSELVTCSGDTTMLLAPTLPHWQLMETSELIEFSISLTGVYSRRHAWLRWNLEEADRDSRSIADDLALREADPDRHEGDEVWPQERLQSLRSTEVDLDECLNHVQVLLDRARTFRLSRNQHSRDLMRYLHQRNGLADLQQGLAHSLQAAEAQQRLVHARVERLATEVARQHANVNKQKDEDREHQHAVRDRPVQVGLTVLAALSFIDLFWWSSDAWGWTHNHLIWGVEAGSLTAIVAIAVVALGLTYRRLDDEYAETVAARPTFSDGDAPSDEPTQDKGTSGATAV